MVLLLCGLAGLSACGGGGSAKPAGTSGPATLDKGTACGRIGPGSASYRHVIWIWMENKDYENVIGSSSAPYLNSLAAECGLATNYHAITNPSLPNYIAATSGLGGYKLNPFYSNCEPGSYCSTRLKSIFAQVPSWRAYQESMPTPCAHSDDGLYAARHNPPIYYRSLTGCAERDLPLTALAGDLATTRCRISHSSLQTSVTTRIPAHLPKATSGWQMKHSTSFRAPAYPAAHTVLFITFDEGEEASRVATVIVSPSTPTARRSGEFFNHYSLLRTTEDLLGVAPLGRAETAEDMAKSFGL